jgi:hypothetical protein
MSKGRYQRLTTSARNAVYEDVLNKLMEEFISTSRRANFL